MKWVDVKKECSIDDQSKVFFINSESKDALIDQLFKMGFKVYLLDGEKIDSEVSFFSEFAATLGFPDYFGKNWDAFYDCMGDFDADGASAVAIVWDKSTSTISKNLYTFVRCLSALVELPNDYRGDPDPEGINQFEVFFIGDGDQFLDL